MVLWNGKSWDSIVLESVRTLTRELFDVSLGAKASAEYLSGQDIRKKSRMFACSLVTSGLFNYLR